MFSTFLSFFVMSSQLFGICKLIFHIFSFLCWKANWQYKETICPDGWLDHHGFCYQYLENAASWDASSSACRDLEGELLSIHSLSQQEIVLTMLKHGKLDILLT